MFRITKPNRVTQEVRRIAREQTSKAIREIDDTALSQADKIHQIRKRCKKIRGLVRLVRPASGELYKIENKWFRDTAQSLSGLRDAKTMQDTYDSIMETFSDELNREAFGNIRRRLTLQRQALIAAEDADERLKDTRDRFIEAGRRIKHWRLNRKGFAAVKGGFKKTYERAVDAMVETESEPSAKAFHEWRKRVKYHRYHCRLIRDIWPGPLQERTDEADRLGDLLGDDHDISVLSQHIADSPDVFGSERTVAVFQSLLDVRSHDLRRQSMTLGARLFGEPTSEFVHRIKTYWNETVASLPD